MREGENNLKTGGNILSYPKNKQPVLTNSTS